MSLRSLNRITVVLIVAVLFLAASAIVVLFGHTKDVSLGQEFTLRQGQTARITGTDLTITLNSITDISSCEAPGGGHFEICGPLTSVTFRYGTTVSSDLSGSPYDLRTVEVNPEYVKYVIYRAGDCTSRGDQCWESAAYRFKRPEACGNIHDADMQRNCYEGLAAYYLNDRASEICSYVLEPREYCLYLKAVTANDIELCRDIGLSRFGPSTQHGWKDNCFGTILRKNSDDVTLCDRVGTVDRKRCRESLSYLERIEDFINK